jgi:peroxiredoxin
MTRILFGVVALVLICPLALQGAEPAAAKPVAEKAPAAKDSVAKDSVAKLAAGDQAPLFRIKDSTGKEIDLAELTARGPVLVRLTCGCTGCDKELAYFQELHEAYKGKGLTSLAVFREPDAKVQKYVAEKKLNMLYAVDSQGDSWNVFKTKTMPTNILIDKGGKIISIAAGCDPSGLLATKVSEKVAGLVRSEKVDVKARVDAKK